jgi:hypothetical protein
VPTRTLSRGPEGLSVARCCLLLLKVANLECRRQPLSAVPPTVVGGGGKKEVLLPATTLETPEAPAVFHFILIDQDSKTLHLFRYANLIDGQFRPGRGGLGG